MRKAPIAVLASCVLAGGAGLFPARAGDSFYGTVTEVKSATTVVLDSGDGRMELRLAGVEAPADGAMAAQAQAFVTGMTLGKPARMRFEYRTADGAMLSRLFTDDPVLGIREVAVEMVRAGMAVRQADYDFKYGELAAAETEARQARVGLWALPEPQ